MQLSVWKFEVPFSLFLLTKILESSWENGPQKTEIPRQQPHQNGGDPFCFAPRANWFILFKNVKNLNFNCCLFYLESGHFVYPEYPQRGLCSRLRKRSPKIDWNPATTTPQKWRGSILFCILGRMSYLVQNIWSFQYILSFLYWTTVRTVKVAMALILLCF